MQQMIIRPWVFPGLLQKPVLSPENIMEAICQHFNVTQKAVTGRGNVSKLVYCRHLYCYLCRRLLKVTLEEAGRVIRRDYTTVINSVRRMNNFLDTEESTRDEVITIINHLKANYSL